MGRLDSVALGTQAWCTSWIQQARRRCCTPLQAAPTAATPKLGSSATRPATSTGQLQPEAEWGRARYSGANRSKCSRRADYGGYRYANLIRDAAGNLYGKWMKRWAGWRLRASRNPQPHFPPLTKRHPPYDCVAVEGGNTAKRTPVMAYSCGPKIDGTMWTASFKGLAR